MTVATTRRFVLLRHEMPPGQARSSHWDLMFDVETDAPLLTWALDELPLAGQSARGRALAPHRRMYLDFEGPISGGRGSVSKWDEGRYGLSSSTWSQWVSCQDDRANAPIEFEIDLQGGRLNGRLTVAREPGLDQCWRFSLDGTSAVR